MERFRTILADPAWDMSFIKRDVRPNQVAMPYPVMKLQDIKNLGITLRPYLADCCHLFLWTTHKHLPFAFEVMEAWGFNYHCLITWDKGGGLTFFGFNRRTEFLLFGYRGKLDIVKTGKAIPTLLSEKATKHSTKPQIVYDYLEAKSPPPRLELFARSKRKGWTVWGNEVEKEVTI